MVCVRDRRGTKQTLNEPKVCGETTSIQRKKVSAEIRRSRTGGDGVVWNATF